jgi:hypothetical protein
LATVAALKQPHPANNISNKACQARTAAAAAAAAATAMFVQENALACDVGIASYTALVNGTWQDAGLAPSADDGGAGKVRNGGGWCQANSELDFGDPSVQLGGCRIQVSSYKWLMQILVFLLVVVLLVLSLSLASCVVSNPPWCRCCCCIAGAAAATAVLLLLLLCFCCYCYCCYCCVAAAAAAATAVLLLLLLLLLLCCCLLLLLLCCWCYCCTAVLLVLSRPHRALTMNRLTACSRQAYGHCQSAITSLVTGACVASSANHLMCGVPCQHCIFVALSANSTPKHTPQCSSASVVACAP